MENAYQEIYDAYKSYIIENSIYNPKVVKYSTNSSAYFPLITCTLSDNTNTDYCSLCKTEYYDAFYFTINIYAKNETQGANIKVASQVIIEELTNLTIKFFGEKLNMKRTSNRPTPNIDTEINRQTIQYQCLIGNVRKNIIRR